MTICSRLAQRLDQGSTPARPRQAAGGAAFHPQIEVLEDRALPSLTLPNDSFLFTPVPDTTRLAMHIHALVHIFVDGQAVTIPANVGNFGTSAYPLHTHDDTGLIHMESPIVRSFALQDFFAIWDRTAQGHAALS